VLLRSIECACQSNLSKQPLRTTCQSDLARATLSEWSCQCNHVRATLPEEHCKSDLVRATMLEWPCQGNKSAQPCESSVVLDWYISLSTWLSDWNGYIYVTENLLFTEWPADWVDELTSRTHCNLLCVTIADLGNFILGVCSIYIQVLEYFGTTFTGNRICTLVWHIFPFSTHDVLYLTTLNWLLQLAPHPKPQTVWVEQEYLWLQVEERCGY